MIPQMSLGEVAYVLVLDVLLELEPNQSVVTVWVRMLTQEGTLAMSLVLVVSKLNALLLASLVS